MGRDWFGQHTPGAISWAFDMTSRNEGQICDKKLYSVLRSDEIFSVTREGDVLCLKFSDMAHYLAYSGEMHYHTFSDEYDALAAVNGALKDGGKPGHLLLIETPFCLEPWERTRFSFGLSAKSKAAARAGLCADAFEETVAARWNNWFDTLPTVSIGSPEEHKLYYKCWWTIKDNYVNDPRWGYSIMESLPVYKGIWQWAMPAVEWHSAQNTEHTSEWIKKSFEILLGAQREDGYVTHAAYLHEINPGEGWLETGTVQNPSFPWVALRYYNVTGDVESLRRWYPKLKKYYEFLCENFDRAHKNYHLWAIHWSFDTGLDTFPAFQDITYGLNGNPPAEYCYPGIFGAERYRYERSMAELSDLLGLGEATAWEAEAAQTLEAFNRILWDEEKCWYGVEQCDGTLDTRVGVDGLFCMVYGMVPADRIKKMEPQFKRLIGDYGVRTCADGEPGFRGDVYWRGPCWPESASLGIAICRQYYPHLQETAFSGILRAFLSVPNIWECFNVTTGELAHSDTGMFCTPCMTSNVGAGQLMGTMWLHHGMDMFGTKRHLPLIPIERYHYAGLWLTIRPTGAGFAITAEAEETMETELTVTKPDGTEQTVSLKAGKTIQI